MAGAGNNGNGNWPSDGGSPDDLPDLPEEWGVIVVPDDLSELSDEVEAIRAELKLGGRPTRLRRFMRRPAMRRLRRIAATAVRTPALIVSMAVLVTVASLFASAWPGPPRQPAIQRTSDSTNDQTGTEGATAQSSGVQAGDPLPALELVGSDGKTVPLRNNLPAVILITDGCDCTALITATTAAVRTDIAVIVIQAATTASTGGTTPPTGATPQAQGKTVRILQDTAGNIRSELKVGPADGTAAVLLVDHNGTIVRKISRAASVDTLLPDLARL
jgi:hypothetical protein